MFNSRTLILFEIVAISVTLSRCGVITEPTTVGVESLFKEIGFSPACVATTLALCESSPGSSSFQERIKVMQNLKKVQRRPANCADLLKQGDKESGVRTVYPFIFFENRAVSVWCDQATDGGGWTVIQHRQDLPLRENFFRNWIAYQLGFGNITGEFWLGLDNIRALVSHTLMELRVDLEDYEGQKRWAKYEHFYVGDAADKYRLDVGDYSGDAGDSLTLHSSYIFSTKDQDNAGNCAKKCRGAWWYGSCHCSSNLNGYQHIGNHTSYGDGINWRHFRGHSHSLKATTLCLRPAFNN